MWVIAFNLLNRFDLAAVHARVAWVAGRSVMACDQSGGSVRTAADQGLVTCYFCAKHICKHCGTLAQHHAGTKCLFLPTEFTEHERFDSGEAALRGL
jgi:hypothetical protein